MAETNWTKQSVTNDTTWSNPVVLDGFIMQSGSESDYYLTQSNGDKLYITRRP